MGAAHDIPSDVTVHAFVKPAGGRLQLLVRVPLKAIRDLDFPVHDYNKDQDANYEQSHRRPPESILAVNWWIQELCKQRGFLYLDYFSAMVDEKGFLKAELAVDGLHPNAAGYRIMGPLAQAAIDRLSAPVAKKGRTGLWPVRPR